MARRTLAAGTVIDSKLITQCLKITQPNVIIRRSRIQASCGWVVDAWITTGQGDWLLIEDSEIICTGRAGNVAGLGECGFIARRIGGDIAAPTGSTATGTSRSRIRTSMR